MRTCSVEQAAAILQVSPRSLSDKRYRARLGLAGRKIGKRLIFAEEDVLRLLKRGRESLPGEGRRWANFLLALLRFCLRQLARRIDARSFDAALSIEIDRICAVLECIDRARVYHLPSGCAPNG